MKHRLESGKTPKGSEQQTFIIEVDILDLTTLQSFPQYLINHVHLLFEGDKAAKVNTYWPIVVEVGGTLCVSEEIMWRLVSDTLPDAKSWVVQYTNVLCELADQTEYGDFIYSDGCNFIGSFALKPFLDRYFEKDESRSNAALPVYECFTNFIRHCDLEFETWQDEYIEKVLSKLKSVSEEKLIELLCLRLSEGQNFDKDFRYLYRFMDKFTHAPSRLKAIIDYFITTDSADIRDSCRYDTYTYAQLCAAIYGSNMAETAEVMAYVENKAGKVLQPVSKYRQLTIDRIKSECDAYRAFLPPSNGFLNSSFHQYDMQNKVWLPLDAKTE